MFCGLDKNGNTVSIEDAFSTEKYHCPHCHTELIQRKGKIKVHHFAHKPIGDCPYSHREMSPWHLEWQSHFDCRQCEVYCCMGGEVCIADVLINDTVIEFQHSSISYDEIWRRTYFHNMHNRKIIWLFDFREKYNYTIRKRMQRMHCSMGYDYVCHKFGIDSIERENLFEWECPNSSITALDYLNNEETIFLFIQLTENLIVYVNWNIHSPDFDQVSFEYFSGEKLTKQQFLDKVNQIVNE